MNRSVIQKILLVITLVTVMGAGTLAQSSMGTTNPRQAQANPPPESGVASTMTAYSEYYYSRDCPLHKSLIRKTITEVSANYD